MWKGERSSQNHHLDRFCTHVDPNDYRCISESVNLAAQEALDLDVLCDLLNPAASEVVTLDVSGTLIKASRATLAKYPQSVLGVMFVGRRKLQLQNNGSVFIDAPAETVLRVISWLQENVVPTDLTSYEANLLITHAKKYRLKDLVVALGGQACDGLHDSLRFTQARLVNCMQVSDIANGGRLYLPGSNLSGLYVSGACLVNSVFTGAFLCGTILAHSNLVGSDLSGADLQYAVLFNANMSGANLSGCNIKNTNLTGVNFAGVDLARSEASGVPLWVVVLANLTHDKSVFKGAILSGAALHGEDLTDYDLSDAKLVKTDLFMTKLTGANFTNADLSNISLPGRDLADGNLGNANLSGADLSGWNKS